MLVLRRGGSFRTRRETQIVKLYIVHPNSFSIKFGRAGCLYTEKEKNCPRLKIVIKLFSLLDKNCSNPDLAVNARIPRPRIIVIKKKILTFSFRSDEFLPFKCVFSFQYVCNSRMLRKFWSKQNQSRFQISDSDTMLKTREYTNQVAVPDFDPGSFWSLTGPE